MAFAFWHLPLQTGALPLPERPRLAAAVDFWRLPMPILLESDTEDSPKSPVKGIPGSDASTIESFEDDLVATPNADVGSPPSTAPQPVPPRAMATEITDMLTRCKAERFDFEQNLRELEEVQARLRALMLKAGEQERRVVHKAPGIDNEGPRDMDLDTETENVLPPDVWHGVLWFLDCESLRLASCCRKGWPSDAEELWARLVHSDWGITVHSGSMHLYRRWLQRFRQMSSTMQALKGGCLTGVTGSLSRKRLFEALETLVELGLVKDTAFYPSQVPRILEGCEAWRTLLSLLEDESPQLQWLATRCLADLVGSGQEDLRLQVREEVVRRGYLVRALLEGDDLDLVEAASRLMLNLHQVMVAPLKGSRGPHGILEAEGYDVGCFATENEALDKATAKTWAQAWSGLWQGEMCYARGGDTHTALRLVLGLADNPQLELAAAELASLAEAARPDGPSGCLRRRSTATAEYWRSFGFLASSDFDSAMESVHYIEEQIQRRREAAASAQMRRLHGRHATCAQSGKDLKLIGVGWNEENGFYTAEAQLPKMPGRSAGAVPLRLSLKAQRNVAYEFSAFLTYGEGDEGRVPVLYGVWATSPSQHKHLFALRRVRTLSSPMEAWS